MLINTKITLGGENFTFADMTTSFGDVRAYENLEHIERAANLRPQRYISDPEIRLANALRAQDAMRRSAMINAISEQVA